MLFRLVFRHFDPELMHRVGGIVLRAIAPFLRPVTANPTVIHAIQFQNRLGIAAGFDKNGKYITALYRLGFGHVEVGTVTPLAQPGNARPRMFRIWSREALVNRMGFNNDGAVALARRLQRIRKSDNRPVIGVNIGKNKATPAERAVDDFRACAETLAKYADYLAVNVSSPNTPGLRDLQQIESLRPILAAVCAASLGRPVFVKIAPDLADADVLAIADLANELGLAGVIAANTTVDRSTVVGMPNAEESGGLSGPMLAPRAEAMIILLRSRLDEGRVIISVGGVTTRADIDQRLRLGASLVQAYTGFVYGGPLWPRRVQRESVAS